MDLTQAGKLIFIGGIVLVAIGALIMLLGRLPFVGQLPGDFEFRRGNATVYFPLATMVLLSILLTLILNLWLRR